MMDLRRRLMKIPSTSIIGFGRHYLTIIGFVWHHPANRKNRMQAMQRLAIFQLRGHLLNRRTLASLGVSSRMWAQHRHWEASKVVYANPPDFREMSAWRRVLGPGDLFIDVGANVGSYTLWAAELGAEVISFEPAPESLKLLRENIDLNGYEVKVIQAAAGAACGSANLTTGLGSANRLEPGGDTECPVVTIDSIVGDSVIAGMKIDVEGFEIDVLRGCARALAEGRVKILQLEWNWTCQRAVGTDRKPVAKLLADYGYDLYRPDLTGRLVPLDDLNFGDDVFARRPEPPLDRGGAENHPLPTQSRRPKP